MKNIVLIGMPGCGKTTFGRALAERLHRPFIDADAYLEEKEGRTFRAFSQKAKRPSGMRKKERWKTFPPGRASSSPPAAAW